MSRWPGRSKHAKTTFGGLSRSALMSRVRSTRNATTELKLLQYCENTGKFAKAEDILFEMLNTDAPEKAVIQRGIAFYTQLRKKNDTVLSAGNFSRVKAEEGLARLKGLQS